MTFNKIENFIWYIVVMIVQFNELFGKVWCYAISMEIDDYLVMLLDFGAFG